jgi:hypothetical protein
MKKIFTPITLLLTCTISLTAQKSITGFKNTDKQLKISIGKRDDIQAKLDELKICPFCGSKLK